MCPECGSDNVVHDEDTDTYDCHDCGACFDPEELGNYDPDEED